MTCSALAIRHFRMNAGDIQAATALISWGSVRAKFSAILKEIADKAYYVKSIAEAQNIKQLSQTNAELVRRLEGLTVMQTRMGHSTVSLPCRTLPFAHNPSFYGRSTILQRLTDALAVKDGTPQIRAVALWGTGGIGKTQIALEFASRQVTAGLPIVLWIACEKETEVANAFNKAAQKLQLPGVLPSNTPDRNRDLVLEYLQKTDVRWLLIFDNVEEATDLQSIWPETGCGNIIVTCRSEFLVDPVVDEVIEVPTFTNEEGSDFMLKIVGQKVASDADVKSALILSDRLGGLALALELIGKQIKIRKKTIEQFLPFYNENRQSLNKQPKRRIKNPYYEKDLDTVWQTSFAGLSPDASRLMMLLSFVAPSDIPEHIFAEGKDLPAEYTFLGDVGVYDDAKLELVSLSLISLNGEASLISLHRLTQQAYLDRMTLEERRGAFRVLISLLKGSFSRTAGRHLYTRWKLCSSLIQHVQALGDRYIELGKTDFFPPFEPLTDLIQNAAWYLQETGSFKASDELIKIAFSNCVDKDSLAYSYLIDTAGTIHDRQGHTTLALDFFQDALRIHLTKSPPGSVEVANAYSAVGVELTASWRPSEALENANKAIANCPTDHDEKLKFNPDRYLRNRGRTYFVAGNFEASKVDLKEAEYWQSLIHGDDSHYHGETAYMFGKIAACQNELDEAYAHFERAVKLMSDGKPTHASVGAARYQQGCVRMRQDNDLDALRLFRDALTICQMNEAGKGTQADSARVKWRMSQVMERQKMAAEAKAYRAAAEATKKTLLATGLYARGVGQEQEYDSLIGLLYR